MGSVYPRMNVIIRWGNVLDAEHCFHIEIHEGWNLMWDQLSHLIWLVTQLDKNSDWFHRGILEKNSTSDPWSSSIFQWTIMLVPLSTVTSRSPAYPWCYSNHVLFLMQSVSQLSASYEINMVCIVITDFRSEAPAWISTPAPWSASVCLTHTWWLILNSDVSKH